jgi:hypothetical protein
LLSPDGKYLSELETACSEGGGSYQLWDIEIGSEVVNWYSNGMCGLNIHTFSPDGQWLIVGYDYEIGVWDIAAAIEEAATNDDRSLPLVRGGVYHHSMMQIRKITLSPDGDQLAVTFVNTRYDTSESHTVYWIGLYPFSDLVEPTDNQSFFETMLTIPDARYGVYSPDGQWLLTDNGLWNAVTAERVWDVSGEIAAFSPDGAVLAVVADEGVAL